MSFVAHDATEADRLAAVAEYKRWLWQQIKSQSSRAYGILEWIAAVDSQGDTLQLGCWCASRACHGEVVAQAAKWMVEKNMVGNVPTVRFEKKY